MTLWIIRLCSVMADLPACCLGPLVGSQSWVGYRQCYDDISGAALSLRILVLDGLVIFFLGGAGVVMQHAFFEERIGGWPVRDLLVQGIGTHMFLELLAAECKRQVL